MEAYMLTLALLVARANGFSNTPWSGHAAAEALPPASVEPAPLFPSDLDIDGDDLISFDEALQLGQRLNCPGLHDSQNYPIMLLWTMTARDLNNDGVLNITEIKESTHVVEGDHARFRSCLHKQRRSLHEQHDGTDRLHSYAVTVPKLIPRWPPIPPALPPETEFAYTTYDSMNRLFLTLANCLQRGPGGSAAPDGGNQRNCPATVTPAGLKAFFQDVIIEFKSRGDFATVHPDAARTAVANVAGCARAASGKMYSQLVTAAALEIVSGAAGAAAFFLNAIPGLGLVVTAASIAAGIESGVFKRKADELKGSLVQYISGMQDLAMEQFQLAPIQQWAAAHKSNSIFITKLLTSISDEYDSLVAFFSTLPIAVQTAMVENTQGRFEKFCPAPCSDPYSALSVPVIVEYIEMAGNPLIDLMSLPSGDVLLERYQVELANATADPSPEFGAVSRSTAVVNKMLTDAGPSFGDSAVHQISQQVVACLTFPLLVKYSARSAQAIIPYVRGGFSVVKAWTIGMTPIPMVNFGGRVMTTIASGGRRALAVFNPIARLPQSVANSAVATAAADYSRFASRAISYATGSITVTFAPLAKFVTRPVAAVRSALGAAVTTGPGAKITSFCTKYIGKAIKGLGVLVSVGIAVLGVIDLVQAMDLYATFRTAIGEVATNLTATLNSLVADAQEVQQLMATDDSAFDGSGSPPPPPPPKCADFLAPQGPGGHCWADTDAGGHCCTPGDFKPAGDAWVLASVEDCMPVAVPCEILQVTTGMCQDLTQADYEARVEGSDCESDNECLSNNCGRAQAGDDNLQCCKAGCTSRSYWGYSYCYCMEPGTPCWSDAMCAPSGKAECEDNGGGFRKGTCTNKPECPDECQYSGEQKNGNFDVSASGRLCCKENGIENERCSLNEKGNTCNCGRVFTRPCYIDMCDKDQYWLGPGVGCVHESLFEL